MIGLRRTLICLALISSIPCLAAPTPPPTAGTRALLDANPGLKAMVEGYKVIVLYGPPFYSGTGNPRTLADAFLASNPDALGVDGVVLVFRREANSGNGRFTVVSYTQQIDALPVHNSLVTIQVFLGSPNRISYIGIRLVHPPEPSLPAGSIDETAAKAVVTGAYGYTTFSTLEEVIYEADNDEIHRAWRFRGWDDDEAYLFFVDTTSGDIIAAVDQVFESDVSVTLTGYATQGSAADDPIEEVVLPGAQVGVLPSFSPSQCGECPSYAALSGEPFSDASGRGSFSGVNAGDTLTANLVGKWVTVFDCGGPNCGPTSGAPQDVTVCQELRTPCLNGNNCPPGDTCDDMPSCVSGFCTNDSCLSCSLPEDCWFCATDLGTVASTPCLNDSACALPETCDDLQECVDGLCTNDENMACTIDSDCWMCSVELGFNEPSDDFRTAAVNAFLFGQATHDWMADLFGGQAVPFDTNLRIYSNNQRCGGQMNSVSGLWMILGSTSATCLNPSVATMVSHEYGHYILFREAETRDDLDFNTSFHEGFADTVASLMWNTDCMFENLFLEPRCDRNIDAAAKANDYLGFTTADCSPAGCEVQFRDERCTGGEVHCLGLALAGAFWDLAKELRCCVNGPDLGCITPKVACTHG